MTAEIHPIASANMLPQFLHAFAHRMTIAKIACFKALQANQYFGLRLFVSQGMEPIGQRLLTILCLISKYLKHGIL